MTCWPPCSAWCECINDQCRPAPFKLNAARIRTPDGRYLRAINGPTVYGGYLGPTSNPPGTWDTFLVDAPGTWPVRSGDQMVLRAVDDTWRPLPDALVRVDHAVLTLPKPGKKDPPMVTYQFGGEDVAVLACPPLSPGYPAYRGDDPGEWTFTVTKFVGGSPAAIGTPIDSGDEVTFGFDSRNPAQPKRAWRLRDDTAPARVDGDGAPGGPPTTAFIVEFGEVRPDAGWRPPVNAPCRQCANVTAVVTRRDTGAPVPAAHVVASVMGEAFSGDSPPAPTDGRAVLTAFVDGAVRDCVPAGAITLQATADRYQISTVTAQVPGQGAIDVPIPMDCTVVSGRITDSAGSPMAGEWVYLNDAQGNPLLDLDGNPFQTKTNLDGRYRFACVPHGSVTVSTDHDPRFDKTVTIGPGGAIVDIVVQLSAATVIVIVVDGDNNDQPITGASVRITIPNGTVTPSTYFAATSGNPPQAAFASVTPAGSANVRASMTGYLPATVPATIPPSGTLVITVRLHHDVAVERPTAFVMQLDWGLVPRDIDLHCSGPDTAGGRFHCLFDDLSTPINEMQPVPYVRLDVDDTNATGPERITVDQVAGAFVPGDYHCWVHNYSGEDTFANSGASVTLLSVDATALPTQRGRWVAAAVVGAPDRLWNVMRFTIDALGQLTVTQVMTYQPGTYSDVL